MIDPVEIPQPTSYSDLIRLSKKLAERVNLITSLKVVPVDPDGAAKFNFAREQAALDLPIPSGGLLAYIDARIDEKIATFLSENLVISASCNDSGTITVTLSLR